MPIPLVLAHRGARRDAPENTLEAFGLALDQGADGVELDVHRTADGELVVHHDADAPGLGVLAALSLAEIRSARPGIPTLEEVLDRCAGSLVNVEIKNLAGDLDHDETHEAARLVVACLERRGGADRVLVSSFNLETVDRVRALAPEVPTGYLLGGGMSPLDALDLCDAHGHRAFHPHVWLLRRTACDRVVRRARELEVQVNVWTVNHALTIKRLASAGVDALITDVPAHARRVLGRA